VTNSGKVYPYFFRSASPQEEKTLAQWDEEVDLICVGSGIGGCAAAIAGAEAGMKVVLVEKSPKLGGTTTWSLGIVWVGSGHLAQANGVIDTPAETRAYLDYLGGGRNDPEVTQSFVDHAPEALRFFESAAQVPFYMVDKLPDHYYPAGAGSKPSGRSHQVRPFEAASLGDWQKNLDLTPYRHGRMTFEEMAARGGMAGQWDKALLAEREAKDIRTFGGAVAGYFLKAVIARQISIQSETEVTRLIFEDGRAAGVEITSSGKTKTIRARRGVVLATGQYDSNPRLMGLFDEFNSWPPRGAPRNQGDGLVIAAEHGAALKVMHWNLTLLLGYHVQGETVDGQPLMRGAGSREVAYPHCIIVNRSGKRFADEASFGEVASKLREFDVWTHRPVNVPCYLIFDAQYWEKYGLQPLVSGSQPPEWIDRADTLGRLARRIGVDADGLTETVERFNRFVAAGHDEDFQRGRMPWSQQASGDLKQKNANLGSLSQPPFFAIELKPISGHSVGLLTNGSGQVIHLRGHAVAGLYACGDVAASLHVGVGYQAGLNLAGGMTFGFMAAQHAAQRSLT
jgi:3-oxosteroid 1-dehydrogenase